MEVVKKDMIRQGKIWTDIDKACEPSPSCF
jgi:hypothetical protein